MSFKRLNGSPHGHTAAMICPDCKKEYELAILEMTRRSKYEPCPACKERARLEDDGHGIRRSTVQVPGMR